MGYEIVIYIALMVASYLISSAMAPKPKVPDPSTFSDFDFPQFDEGTPQPVFFGDCWTSDWMVIGLGNFRTQAVSTGGGKK